MMPRWRRASLRWLRRHPWQLGLAVLGIALGVSVVVAVQLATTSAAHAFALSMNRINGDARQRIVGPPEGLDEAFYRHLRVDLGVRASAPVVEGFARLDGETLRVLGVDPIAQAGMASPGAIRGQHLQRLLTDPDTMLLAAPTAQRLGVAPGDTVTLEIGGHRRRVQLLGLPGRGPRDAAALEGLAVVDIATAQAWFHRLGRLDYIDLRLDPGRARALARRLPPGLELQPASARTREARDMTSAFRTNLDAMGLLAIVVGVFLIYNTMTFSVVQRRRLIGTLRALGVTRGQIFGQVVFEALILGAVGTLIGLVAGVGLAHGLVGLVTRTINDLYFVLTVRTLYIAPGVLALGAGIGLGAALLAALAPAAEAAASPPDSAGRRSVLERRTRGLVPGLTLAGLVVLAAAALLAWLPGGGLGAGFAALAALLAGAALIIPGALVALVPLTAAALGRVAGPLGRMAARGITAALSRTALAVIALTIALSATVGVGVMIDSFRTTVAQWLDRTLAADLYVSPPQRVAARHFASLPRGTVARVRAVAGVGAISTGWRVEINGPSGPTPVFALRPTARGLDAIRLAAGDREQALARFRAGQAVLVSEAWATHHDIGPGDTVTLQTERGAHAFAIAGVYYDYNTDRGVVLMHRDLYQRWWSSDRVSSIGVFLAPGADPDVVAARVRAALTDLGPVLVRSSARIRTRSLQVFDQTFAITAVLRTLALGVAFVGVLTALLALQLERGRDLAILRATGATPNQVRAQVGLQTGAIGLLSGLLSLPLGLVLADVLIHVINRRAFGWSIATRIDPSILAEALALALVAALLAGAWPAWRAARVEPADALRSE